MGRNNSTAINASNRIIIRVNGGKKIGMGHVYRTLTIANILRHDYKFNVDFIINNDQAVQEVLGSFSHSYAILYENGDSLTELADIVSRFDCPQSSLCLMDTQEDVSNEIRVFNTYHVAVVLLLNKTPARLLSAVNIYPLAHFDYMAMDWNNYEGKVVGGGEYIPLAEPFLLQRKNLQPISARKYILVTMGGTDPNKLTSGIMDALSGFDPSVPILIVLGHAFNFKEEVYVKNKRFNGRFEIIENANNMHELMAGAALAITAIGITIYELCFLGVPMVLISNYEHDSADEQQLEKLGCVAALGFFKHVSNTDIFQVINSLWLDMPRRVRMSDLAINITDGHGGERICKEIASLHAFPRR